MVEIAARKHLMNPLHPYAANCDSLSKQGNRKIADIVIRITNRLFFIRKKYLNKLKCM